MQMAKVFGENKPFDYQSCSVYHDSSLDPNRNQKYDILDTKIALRRKIDPLFGN